MDKQKGASLVEYQFKNLVLEGGGVKGIAYVGALEVISDKGILTQLERVGGTSAGAITALLIGLAYSSDEIKEILWDMDFSSFLDASPGVIRNDVRLVKEYGWYKGDTFREWVGKIIKDKTGNSEATFRDVEAMRKLKGFKDLYFIGTNLSTRFSEVFSSEHTPDMVVADAVRISMSIPIFFAAIRRPNRDIYVDGGVLDNYPIQLFDKGKYMSNDVESLLPDREYNHQTLGFRLDSTKEISVFEDHTEPEHHEIEHFTAYVKYLAETLLEVQSNSFLQSEDWHRTIYIDSLGVKTTDFHISNEKKDALVQSGKEYAKKYFEWYDKPDSMPLNKKD